MSSTEQAILVGAISGGIVAILGAIGIFIINQRSSRSLVKKSDIADLEASYKTLQARYEAANEKLTDQLNAERAARESDKRDCQKRIDHLQDQLTALLAGPLSVKLIGVEDDVVLPTEIVRPLPVPMTPAVAAAVAAAVAEINKESSP